MPSALALSPLPRFNVIYEQGLDKAALLYDPS
jgi:hypothetical protein